MKKRMVLYWIFTGMLLVFMVATSIPDAISVPSAIALFKHLGYPPYLLPFLGIAKLLGVVALAIPGFPRVKEWVYAGFVFDLTGALYSSISVGDSDASGWLLFLIGYILIAGSYIFHLKKVKSDLLRSDSKEPYVAAGSTKQAN